MYSMLQVTVCLTEGSLSSSAPSTASSALFLTADQMEEMGAQGAVVGATGDTQLDDQCLIENFGETDTEGS